MELRLDCLVVRTTPSRHRVIKLLIALTDNAQLSSVYHRHKITPPPFYSLAIICTPHLSVAIICYECININRMLNQLTTSQWSSRDHKCSCDYNNGDDVQLQWLWHTKHTEDELRSRLTNTA